MTETKRQRKTKRIRTLSKPEFDLVMEQAGAFEGDTGPHGRNAMSFILGLHGMRSIEICQLVGGDLDIGCELIFVDTVKRGEEREVELEPRIIAWLRKFAAGQPDCAPLLRTRRGRALTPRHIRRSWQRLSLRWIGHTIRFHATRHSAAQRLFEETRDLLAVQNFLGHRTMQATMIYAKKAGSVRKHMPKLPPRQGCQPMPKLAITRLKAKLCSW